MCSLIMSVDLSKGEMDLRAHYVVICVNSFIAAWFEK